MLVGLPEVTGRGFGAPAAATAPTLTLVGTEGPAPTARRDTALESIYDAQRRIVRLLDLSDTGLGLECAQSAAESIAVGDLVGVRIADEDAPVIGKVVRSAPSKRPGRMILGVLRLSHGLEILPVAREHSGGASEELRLTYVPGGDTGGRQDAFLVSERAYTERGTMTTRIDDTVYSFRFNRVRQRGRGWVMAGFEVISARRERAA
jgi:hypothetical protein